MNFEIRQGDALERLREMPDNSVQCCVTSPPYFGLRDYQVAGQIGLEDSPAEYIDKLVKVFAEVRRVVQGTCWINIGDSYANDGKWGGHTGGKHVAALHASPIGRNKRYTGLKPKDLIGIPWRLAFALQDEGWWLRAEIIWSKPNVLPESVRDRPTKAHEQLFLFAAAQTYYYDAEAIKEPASADTHARYARGRSDDHKWADGGPGDQTIARTFEHMRVGKEGRNSRFHQDRDPNHPSDRKIRAAGVNPKCAEPGNGIRMNTSFSAAVKDVVEFRNKRTVWEIATQPFPEAHFATFPEALVEPCILAGSQGPGKRCDCDELILAPTGSGESGDPTRLVGRAGYERERREGEGRRPITRREQREYAKQIQCSPYRAEMAGSAGEAFAHYIRTDKSGARPLPQTLLDHWLRIGWLRPPGPCDCPEGEGGTVLDPFCGSGTVGVVALRHRRNFIGIELKPEYCEMAQRRIGKPDQVYLALEAEATTA